jgi:hypothetical protein
MAKYEITFEIELPTEDEREAKAWAEFELGFNGHLKGGNSCSTLSLPASWDDLYQHSLRVRRHY